MTADPRCWWCLGDDLYEQYHDHEWGRPVRDDTRLFEKLCLEGFQSGLSWLTILRKREAFRAAFCDFDPVTVARFDERDVARLLDDAGIVRHRGKIEASINNARRLIELREREGTSFSDFIWQFVPPAEERPATITREVLMGMAQTPASKRLARTLRTSGFRFVGPTTAYAFMQSMGLVNDHVEGCPARTAVVR